MTYTKILVTGGCGFIGSNFIRHLYISYPNYQIFNLDLLTYAGNPENLRDIEEAENLRPENERRYRFIRGDVCDLALLEKLFSSYRFGLVVNFAAESHVDRSIVNMTDFVRTNIGGVRSLIDTVRKHKIARLVHISTDEVYGSVESGHADETAPLRPSNPYSASKAAGDLLLLSFMKAHQIPAIIVRGSNNYGPFQYPEKLIPLAISNIFEERKIPIHGDGKHIRSWLHVEDFCRAVDLVAHRAPDFEIYNVSGEEKSNSEIISLLARYLNRDSAEYCLHINDRPGADRRYAPDSSKLQRELGWAPLHKLENSLPEVVSWYLRNRPWWQKIKATKEYCEHYAKQSQGQWY